jgi:hypothetical protein
VRLRYLRVRGVPPLGDLALRFQREPLFRSAYGVHFVVGVNGSGKTRLLRALTDVFLGLEAGRAPAFPVTLVYEMGRREGGPGGAGGERLCWIDHPGGPGQAAHFAVFDLAGLKVDLDEEPWRNHPAPPVTATPWKEALVRHGPLSQLGSGSELDQLLPAALVVYTSGAIEAWEEVFGAARGGEVLADAEVDPEDERPAGWTMARETEYASRSGNEPEPPTSEAPSVPESPPPATPAPPTRATLLASDRLPLAAWAVLLDDAARTASPSEQSRRTLAADLRRVGWTSVATLALRLRLDAAAVAGLGTGERAVLRRLHRVATFARREPAPGTGRLLAFDLAATVGVPPDDPAAEGWPPFSGSTARAVLWAFGEAARPFDVFRTLYDWSRRGIVEGAPVVLSKRDVEGLLTLDDLSDGERMYVGRISVLHLLRGTDDALVVLDEPETHFNDAWKREIVDIIDGVMRRRTSEVVISTHSSIALTDAFDSEIVLVERMPGGGRVGVVRTPIHTFGASPTEIMRHVFGAPGSAGQRATEYLDLLLLVADHPRTVHAFWRADAANDGAGADAALDRLGRWVAELPHDYGALTARRDMLRDLLRSLHAHARQWSGKTQVTMSDVLGSVRERVGSGYYQFELIRRMRSNGRGRRNAAPNQ